MVDDPSGFWIASGGSLDCTISDVTAAAHEEEGADGFRVVGAALLDPKDDVPSQKEPLS